MNKAKDSNDLQVFFDPSGKRWHLFKIVVTLLLFLGIFLTLLYVNSIYKTFKFLEDLNNIKEVNSSTLITKKYKAFIDEQSSYILPNVKENIEYLSDIIFDYNNINIQDKKLIFEVDLKENISIANKYVSESKHNINRLLGINTTNLEKNLNLDNLFLNSYNKEESVKNILTYLEKYNLQGINFNLSEIQNKKIEEFILDLAKEYKLARPNSINSIMVNTVQLENKSIMDIIKNNFQINIKLDYQLQNKDLNFQSDSQKIIEYINLNKTQIIDIVLPSFVIKQKINEQVSFEKISFEEFSKSVNYETIKNQGYSYDLKINNKNSGFYVDIDNYRFHLLGNLTYFNLIAKFTSEIQNSSQILNYGLSNFTMSQSHSLDFNSFTDQREQVDFIKNNYNYVDALNQVGRGGVYTLVKEPRNGKLELILSQDSQYIKEVKITENPTQGIIEKSGIKNGKITMTFDDGPAKNTGKVLDILREFNVKATFFVTGSNILKYPQVAERIMREGHAIGNHSFSHPKFSQLSNSEIDQEVKKTDFIIEELTRVKPKYFRTPYTIYGDIETKQDLEYLKIINKSNLILNEYDIDPNDWNKKDPETLVKETLQKIDNGSQLLLHDNGSGEDNTLKALPEIINQIKSRGFSFVAIDEVINQKEQDNKNTDPVFIENKNNKNILIPFLPDFKLNNELQTNLSYGHFLFIQFAIAVAILRILIILFSLLYRLLIFIINKFNGSLQKTDLSTNFTPPISVLIPCYNEEKVVCNTIASILNANYPEFEVIVIIDGSTDKSLQVVNQYFQDHPQVVILPKVNGGKASALNYGVSHSKYNYVVAMDADTIFEKNALKFLMNHFKDKSVGAVAGNVQVGNDYFLMKSTNSKINFIKSFNWLTSCQRVEYIFSQNFDKLSYDTLGCVLVVPGAIGGFRKEALIESGGYKTNTLAEDTDLTINILKNKWIVRYEKNSQSITEAPETLKAFIKQRFRWQYGTLQILFKNMNIIMNFRYGMVGLFATPYMVFSYLAILLSPFVNIVFIYYFIRYFLSFINNIFVLSDADILIIQTSLILFFFFAVFEVITTIIALLLDKSKNKFQLLFIIPIQILIYRPLISVITFWVIIKSIQGKAQGWGHLKRTGSVSLDQLKGM